MKRDRSRNQAVLSWLQLLRFKTSHYSESQGKNVCYHTAVEMSEDVPIGPRLLFGS
jgi:hypothetical protein